MTRTKRRPILPEAEHLPEIFSEAEVEQMARRAFQRPKQWDLIRLRSGIIAATEVYLDAVAAPSRGEMKREIEGLVRLASSGNHFAVGSALESLSQQTYDYIESRKRGPLPCHDALWDPGTRKRALRQIILLCTSGTDGQGNYVLFAPPTQRNAPKRVAERDFIFTLRYVMSFAADALVGRTAPRLGLGPLCTLATDCFRLLGVSNVNVALILSREGKKWRWGRVVPKGEKLL